jgi:hypothetical protein
MNWKGYGRKWLLSNKKIITAFAQREQQKLEKPHARQLVLW